MIPQRPGYVVVAERFKQYNQAIKDVWATYNFISHYLKEIHSYVKNGDMNPYTLESLSGKELREHSKDSNNTYGMISHIERLVNPERALISSVALTEDFLKDIVTTVYTFYPGKLLTEDSSESADREIKLLDVILKNETKDEMISRIIEEKVRGIFYGNPIDFFTKDKKIGLSFGEYFKEHHSKNLKIFTEILARRNIYAHNNGRIDRKYLREVKDSPGTFGHKPVINREYIRTSIIVMRGLSATAGVLVSKNIFKATKISGNIEKVNKTFNKYFIDSAPDSNRVFSKADCE